MTDRESRVSRDLVLGGIGNRSGIIDRVLSKQAAEISAACCFDFSGGAGGIRTLYLFNAIEALSQLSYSPDFRGVGRKERGSFVPN